MPYRSPVRTSALLALVLALASGCSRASRDPAEATSGGEQTVHRGLELAPPDATAVLFVDVAALRASPLGPFLAAALAGTESDPAYEAFRAVHDADRLWGFVSLATGRTDVVLLLEGASAEPLVRFGAESGKLEFVGRRGAAFEYALGPYQVAYRAPDTVVVAGALLGEDGAEGPIRDWAGAMDRLAGTAPATRNEALEAARAALAPERAALWGTLLWSPETTELALSGDTPPDATTTSLLAQLLSFGLSAELDPELVRLHAVVQGRDPGLAHMIQLVLRTMMQAPPAEDEGDAAFAALLREVETHVDGSTLHASLALSPERIAELVESVQAELEAEPEPAATPAQPPAPTQTSAPTR